MQKTIKSKFAFWFCYLLEKMSGPDPVILEQIRSCDPDVVMIVAGGAGYGSFDVDYLIAARALEKKTAVFTLSWDSLAIKAFIQFVPDLLLVWNDDHVKEAELQHGIQAEKIKIVGAPAFDLWFEKRDPALSKEEFRKKAGLNTENFVVFFGSPSTVAEDDRWLIEKLRGAMDENGMKNISILVRPHPAHSSVYSGWEKDHISVYPKKGHLPDSIEATNDLFDTIHYSLAAVAINTSAMAEAVIIGKPVIALLEEKYLATQTEAPHFISLRASGALDLAENPTAASRIISSILTHTYIAKNKTDFIKTYIRPKGLTKPAGESAVLELEKLVIDTIQQHVKRN